MASVCRVCGGPIRSDNKTGICQRNPACRSQYARDAWDKWEADHPGERQASKRAWAERNPDYQRDYSQQRDRDRTRQQYAKCVHGPEVVEWHAEAWAAQDGRCYLCGTPAVKPVIDHDHECCQPGRSCPACRRGIACDRCNRLIGMVGDDPDLLRRIAGNLELVLGPTRDRIAAKSHQLTLDDMET